MVVSILVFLNFPEPFQFRFGQITWIQIQRQATSQLFNNLESQYPKNQQRRSLHPISRPHSDCVPELALNNLMMLVFQCINVFHLQNLKMKTISIALLGLLLVSVSNQQAGPTDCSAVTCLTGYDCVEGVCVRQRPQARKKLCSLNLDLAPVKCTNRDYQCTNVIDSPSCGFSPDGTKTSFTNDCLPCLHHSISFYYNVPCEQAPQVCSQDEECVNGKCTDLFRGQKFDRNAACASNSECRPIIERCVAGKCIKLTDIVNVLQTSRIQRPQI